MSEIDVVEDEMTVGELAAFIAERYVTSAHTMLRGESRGARGELCWKLHRARKWSFDRIDRYFGFKPGEAEQSARWHNPPPKLVVSMPTSSQVAEMKKEARKDAEASMRRTDAKLGLQPGDRATVWDEAARREREAAKAFRRREYEAAVAREKGMREAKRQADAIARAELRSKELDRLRDQRLALAKERDARREVERARHQAIVDAERIRTANVRYADKTLAELKATEAKALAAEQRRQEECDDQARRDQQDIERVNAKRLEEERQRMARRALEKPRVTFPRCQEPRGTKPCGSLALAWMPNGDPACVHCAMQARKTG